MWIIRANGQVLVGVRDRFAALRMMESFGRRYTELTLTFVEE